MNIKNKPIVNRDPHSALLNSLRTRIKQLEEENMRLTDLLRGQGIVCHTTASQGNTNNALQGTLE